MKPKGRLLVIDDEPVVGALIADCARKMGHSCTTTTDPASFLEALTPDITLVILDLMMPYIDGIELLRELANHRYSGAIVLMSGVDRNIIELAEQLGTARGLNVVNRLAKPFGLAKLKEVLTEATGISLPTFAEPESVSILDEHLRAAIQQEAFDLHYQPQIRISSRAVVGFEGLVRWLHPELGVVYPDRFISRLERLNLIDQLGWIVLKKGIISWSCLAELGGEVPTLSLNLAPQSLNDLELPDRLERLLREQGMPPAKLILEVTESALIQNLPSTLDVLVGLRLKGIQIAIDDFGMGFSTLQQLRRLPATELKVDKSFVHDMLAGESGQLIVQKTIELGHGLGMRVVAEGVETDDQLKNLAEQGCDVAQNYLICKPYPLAVAFSWLSQYRPYIHSPLTALVSV